MSKVIIIATNNPHKVHEIKGLLKNFNLKTLKDIGFEGELEENGTTLEVNSYQKAQQIWDKYHLPCLADDSGLEVSCLNGDPGVYSARYAGLPCDDQRNMVLLLNNLKGKTNREAFFKTILTYIDTSGQVHQFRGEVCGVITSKRRGNNGFGYDPIFQPHGFNQTFADMTDQMKAQISHRSRAIHNFVQYMV